LVGENISSFVSIMNLAKGGSSDFPTSWVDKDIFYPSLSTALKYKEDLVSRIII
jgi:hypothetical protein